MQLKTKEGVFEEGVMIRAATEAAGWQTGLKADTFHWVWQYGGFQRLVKEQFWLSDGGRNQHAVV